MTKVPRLLPMREVISAPDAQAGHTKPPSAASATPNTDTGVLAAAPDEQAEAVGTGAVFDDVW